MSIFLVSLCLPSLYGFSIGSTGISYEYIDSAGQPLPSAATVTTKAPTGFAYACASPDDTTEPCHLDVLSTMPDKLHLAVILPCDSGYTARGAAKVLLSPVEVDDATRTVTLDQLPAPYCGQDISEWSDLGASWQVEATFSPGDGAVGRVSNVAGTIDCTAYESGLSATADVGMRCHMTFDALSGASPEEQDAMIGGWASQCGDAGVVFALETPATELNDQRVVQLCRKECLNHNTWNGCGDGPKPFRCCEKRDTKNYCRLVDSFECPVSEYFRGAVAEDESGIDVGVVVAIAAVGAVCCCTVLACGVLLLVRQRTASSRRATAKAAAQGTAGGAHRAPSRSRSRRASVSRSRPQ